MKELRVIRKSYKRLRKKYRSFYSRYHYQLKAAALFLAFCFSVYLGSRAVDEGVKTDVYAASEYHVAAESYDSAVPPGISGALAGVWEPESARKGVERIGTSCEEVIVGQRVQTAQPVREMDASEAFAEAMGDFTSRMDESCRQSAIMSDADYETLLAIVEAEAGGEDLEGRIMVANVILNRVGNNGFPDTVHDVVWEVVNGMPQFSPTSDGRISTVTVSETTRQAVHKAIEGTDYSRGALFFVAKDQANQENVRWFDRDLKFLFKHGVHSFYTYPDDTMMAKN